GGYELQSVANEVHQDLLDPPMIGDGAAQSGWQVGRELDLARSRDQRDAVDDPSAHLLDRDLAKLDRQRPRVEPGELEEIADQVGHRLDDASAPLEELPLDQLVVDTTAEDQLEIAGQPGEWRPEVVGDRR